MSEDPERVKCSIMSSFWRKYIIDSLYFFEDQNFLGFQDRKHLIEIGFHESSQNFQLIGTTFIFCRWGTFAGDYKVNIILYQKSE